ncbi:pyridoxamine 5'-phosphate oxidase family protein [Faecalibacillus intestinalis]|uniref:pyridoxamine 5'-phosphate oxidase family protein n=1 Tax=Faecalibacillus intestinalis TaxID=1982626 RepID=UPI00295F2290|nr:pyridoxamine 5'-phosphate oxidase family protein [Faecalibacillus intestinalis]MEE1446374.1 pyridoxamine 5'-phosphate oxidase family protein [Faecalibacillus intestinalis]
MDKVLKFLKDAETYYLATVEGDQPRVRLFGTAHVFEGKLYIQTGKVKDVSKQLHQNPKSEICAFKNGEWLRVSGKLIEDDRNEARQSMLDAYPSLQKMYKADDGNTEVFYFENATAIFSSFTHEPQIIKF